MKQTCWTCGTSFETGFYVTKCNVCKQSEIISRSMEKKTRVAVQQEQPLQYTRASAPIYTWFTEEDRNKKYNIIPPDPIELEKSENLKRLDKIYTYLLWASPLYVLPILWFITSGWLTLFSFLAFPFAFVGIGKYHHYWRMSNAYYLYTIGPEYVPIP